MPLNLPDYAGGSIVNLMSSLTSGCGVGPSSQYAPLQGLDIAQLRDARNVVLMVIDGLGYHYLTTHGAGSAMASHLCRPIDAVAPPTTAASVTTFLTGLAPQQHGLTGWFTWFREIGSVVTVLPFLSRCNRADLAKSGITPQLLFGNASVFERMTVDCFNIMPYWLSESAFNAALQGQAERVLHNDLNSYLRAIVSTVRRDDRRKYLYAYWPTFDALAHDHGVDSPQVAAHFAELDHAFVRLLTQLRGSDTLVMLTADHGFIDTTKQSRLQLGDMPVLQRCLQVPLCGEPRLVHCHVRHDERQTFTDYVRDELGHAAVLYPSCDLIDLGLYGQGEAHPELASRVGDYTLVMKDNYILTQRLPGEGPLDLIGHHGGLSRDEIAVPLVVVGC